MPRSATILVGIANTAERVTLVNMLHREGHAVVPASDGFHLVEFMADAILNSTDDVRPDLIIADAILPGCTGMSLLSGLRALHWETPIILLAPYDDPRLRREASMRGATAFFAQPCSVEKLLGITRELFGRSDCGEEPRYASPG